MIAGRQDMPGIDWIYGHGIPFQKVYRLGQDIVIEAQCRTTIAKLNQNDIIQTERGKLGLTRHSGFKVPILGDKVILQQRSRINLNPF